MQTPEPQNPADPAAPDDAALRRRYFAEFANGLEAQLRTALAGAGLAAHQTEALLAAEGSLHRRVALAIQAVQQASVAPHAQQAATLQQQLDALKAEAAAAQAHATQASQLQQQAAAQLYQARLDAVLAPWQAASALPPDVFRAAAQQAVAAQLAQRGLALTADTGTGQLVLSAADGTTTALPPGTPDVPALVQQALQAAGLHSTRRANRPENPHIPAATALSPGGGPLAFRQAMDYALRNQGQ